MNQEYQEQYFSPDTHNHWSQYILWFFIFLFSLIGSVSLSLIIYLSANNEWDVARYYSNSSLDFALNTFPFYLLILVIPALLLSIVLFKFTSTGRKFSFYFSFIIFCFSIVFFALFFFYTGTSNKTNNLIKNYEFYELIIKNRNALWQNPDFGLLSGEIGAITDLDNFLLIDFDNKVWTIQGNRPKIADKSIIQSGNKIKIIGRKNSDNTFETKEIRAY